MVVNNGQYRKSTFVMRRYINNRELLSGDFPIIERIDLPFAETPGITLQELALLTDSEYLNRLNLFHQYLEIKYPFFKAVNFPNTDSYGTSLAQCPLDYDITQGVFANLRLELSESGTDKEAEVHLDLTRFDNSPVSAGNDFTVTLLVKQFYGQGFLNWDSVEGDMIDVVFGPEDTTKQVLNLFRYKGTDDQSKDFKNVFVQIFEIEEEAPVEIGSKNIVFTEGFEPFYLVNLISNIETSAQSFPNTEALEAIIGNGQGIQNGNLTEFAFSFSPNAKSRPVFIYPATFPDLKSIEYANYEGMDVLDAGVFDTTGTVPKTKLLNGVNYKVYASRNLIIHPYTIKYLFKF
jgi:hypothetical protein